MRPHLNAFYKAPYLIKPAEKNVTVAVDEDTLIDIRDTDGNNICTVFFPKFSIDANGTVVVCMVIHNDVESDNNCVHHTALHRHCCADTQQCFPIVLTEAIL